MASQNMSRVLVDAILGEAGVQLDGDEPWSPRIRRDRALLRFLTGGTIGAGESYVDGDWDCDALDELCARLLRAHAHRGAAWARAVGAVAEVSARIGNRQTESNAPGNSAAHYDRGNDLYEAMLGESMTYSCGYWREAGSLEEAQEKKHDLVCRKLQLQRGQRVLDIGCGFGAFARFAAERYGVSVVGVTLSAAQAEVAQSRCAGFPVEIVVDDYRHVVGAFDRIASIGMFEHVGPKNHRVYFETVKRLLKRDGFFLLHTIGASTSTFRPDPWLHRYVFPNAVLPSAAQITAAFEGLLHLEDWQNFGVDYDRTLHAWLERFDEAWPRLSARYGDRFRRLWRYYLLVCAGTFRARHNHLWQLVLANHGVDGVYRRVV